MKLHTLTKSSKSAKRVGRGPASGSGKTAGRGMNGQKSRSGHHMMPVRFEGGQMPLTQRIPKLRGFTNPVAKQWASVGLNQLNQLGGTKVTYRTLRDANLVPRYARYVKIIGNEVSSRKLTVTVERISASAQKSIEKAGGSVTLTEPENTDKDAR